MRIALRLVGVVLAILALAAAGVALLLWRTVPPLAGRESLPGLSADAEVVWDALAVPHIVAQSDADAMRVLGYLHARDRLWGMEVLRRAAEGRVAEILGPRGVEADRFLRSLDIPHVARAVVALGTPESRALLDAYVDGINQWIAHHTRPLGPEFQILRFAPEPWRAEHVAEIARIMSWDLANASNELELARARARLGDRVRELFPWIPDTGLVILPKGSGSWSAGAVRHRGGRTDERTRADVVPRAHLALGDIPRIPALARELLDAAAMTRASNSWVIGPARSASGKPILANDPHLTLRTPSLWYLAAIESPSYSVVGATLPGVPAVVLGHNRRIAWGLTNIEADDLDYVIERMSPESTRVLTPDGWADVEAVRDSIRVKGGKAVPFTLRRTPDGPIVGADPSFTGPDSGGTVRALAMRWVGSVPSDELTALFRVDKAGSWDEFLRAVALWKSPEQNWVYADVDGNIGYTASGNIPVRRSGAGLLPTPGWTGEGAWERFLDFSELPRALNPKDGFIVTANNRVVGPEYPFLLTASPALPYRAERIREMILAKDKLAFEDVRRMQMDSVDRFARWARAIAAHAADETLHPDVARELRAWDGTMGADRREPAVFWAWYRALQRRTYQDESPTYMPNSPLQHWMLDGRSPWFDDVRTSPREGLATVAADAMRDALLVVGLRNWGQLHPTIARHPLGAVRALDLLLGLNIGPRPRAGSLYTVDVADFGQFTPPYVNTHGPSFRQVVDMADVEGAGMIITSGESGDPWSPHYRDQRDRWWKGELWTVPLSSSRVRGGARLVLSPR